MGNCGIGMLGYCEYGCDYVICVGFKLDIFGLLDLVFCGDVVCWNFEDLLFVLVLVCYKLWYLYLCLEVGICVLVYVDYVEGMMFDGVEVGCFIEIVLCL